MFHPLVTASLANSLIHAHISSTCLIAESGLFNVMYVTAISLLCKYVAAGVLFFCMLFISPCITKRAGIVSPS